jgi:hypothetical protein
LLRRVNAYREGVDRVRNNGYAVYGIMKLPLAEGDSSYDVSVE